MPPEASTAMITTPPRQPRSIASMSTISAVSKQWNHPRSDNHNFHDQKMMGKGGEEQMNGHQSDQKFYQQLSEEYSSNGYGTSHPSNDKDNEDAHDMSMPTPFGARNSIADLGALDQDLNDMDDDQDQEQPTTTSTATTSRQAGEQQQQDGDVGESSRESSKNNPSDVFKEPLHKTLYDDFHTDLTSLRDATIDALQLSCQEQERLCFKGEELEARIAYMRKKIDLAREELLEKGALKGGEIMFLNDNDDNLRLSLVKEGEEEELNATGRLGTLEEGKSTENSNGSGGMKHSRSNSRFNTNRGGGLHGSLISKGSGGSNRLSMRSQLHGSQTSHLSKASNMSEATNMPHMSRSSLLGMLGASKNWLDNYAHTATETEQENNTRGSMANIRISFMEGAGDGMPSRWRAREQEREKTAKQKEEEERRLQQQKQAAVDEMQMNHCSSDNSSNYNSISASAAALTIPVMRQKSKAEKLQDLIAKREAEIATLESRTLDVKHQTSTLQDELSTLEIDQRHEESEYERDRRKLLAEIAKVESDNSKLDFMLVETGVSLEEKKIIVEILATELKGARGQLAHTQNERDRVSSERKQRKNRGGGGSRARRFSGWMRNSASNLLGIDLDQEENDDENDGDELDDRGQQQHEQQQQQQGAGPQSAQAPQGQQDNDKQNVSRYQVPNDVLQQYQNLVNSSDDDTSGDNLDHPSGGGGSGGDDSGGENGHQGGGLDRRRSYASVGTCMSSLTLDSCELVDILEQLELDT